MSTKSTQDDLEHTQVELARIRAREARSKQLAEEKIQELEATIASLHAQLADFRESKKLLSQEKKKLTTAARDARQKLKTAQEELRLLQSRLPGLEHLMDAANFLQDLPGQLRARLDDQGYALNDLPAFLCRCGNRDALLALWRTVRTMAVNGEAHDTADEFLGRMLHMYNQGASQKLAACTPGLAAFGTPEARDWWVVPFCEEWWRHPEMVARVLLPGLMDAEGAMLVEPLLELRH